MKRTINIFNIQNKNVIIYLFSDLLAKALPFLFIPILTMYLNPEQYGNISLFNIGVEIFVIFIIMGGNSYYKIEYFNFENPISSLYNIIFNVTLLFAMALFFSVPLYLYFDSVYLFKILPIILLCAYLQSLLYLYISYYQCNEKALIVGGINLFFSLCNSLLMIFLLSYMEMNESSRYLSFAVSLMISVLLSSLLLGFKNKVKISAKINVSLLKFGVGIFPHAISWWARSGVERLLIGWYLSISSLGIYSLAMQLTSLMPLLCNAINQALMPKIVRSLNEKKICETKKILFKATAIVMVVCVTSSFAMPMLLRYFLDHRYFEALTYLPYMILVFIFQSVIVLYSNILYFYKNVKYLSSVTFCTSCLHICLAIILLKNSFNIYSVIISSAITFLIASSLVFRKAMLLMRDDYDI
ncbi:lipopolysaccharide biosynthesis protein [Citrobacter sp. Marseille-Q6884]|uniref:lipopolysaccharide biosynthesis protein n=1 Tax=Citrobacter sp. Marseille-Q6884 TaxID=2956786 RepID=UPI0021B2F6D2|nr:oligosaccharide flippase family protein [Citrobacter sp. Marseille-Q6884]